MDVQELLKMGNTKYSSYNFFEALEYYIKALSRPETKQNLQLELDIREKISRAYYRQNNFNEAIRHLEILEVLTREEQFIRVITLKSINLYLMGQFRDALSVLDTLDTDCYDIARRKKLMTQGVIFLKIAQHFDPQKIKQAIKCFEATLELTDDPIVVHKTLRNLGISYNFSGDYFKSLHYFEEAIKYTNSDHAMSYTYHELANTYAHLNNFEKALSLLDFCHKVAKDNKDHLGLGYTFKNLGEVHFLQTDFYQGEDLTNKAIDHFLWSKSYPEISDCFKQLSKHLERKQPIKSQMYLREHNRYKSKLAI